MTIKELVEDTIKYYTEDPSRRGVTCDDNGREKFCSYITSEGKKCAVGRWIDEDKLKTITGKSLGEINDWGGIFANELYKWGASPKGQVDLNLILKDEVKDVPLQVWQDLQNFHDKWEPITKSEKLLGKYSN